MCGNMKPISCIDEDISRVNKANELDILFNTRNNFIFPKHASMYCSVYYIKNSPIAPQK